MNRLRAALGVDDNKALAIALGMKPNAFYNRRSSGSVPVEQVVTIAKERGISSDWLFFGVGSSDISGKKKSPAIAEIDHDQLLAIQGTLDAAIRAEGLELAPLAETALLTSLATGIYNGTLLMKPGAARQAAIASQCEAMARALVVSRRRLIQAPKDTGAHGTKRGAQ